MQDRWIWKIATSNQQRTKTVLYLFPRSAHGAIASIVSVDKYYPQQMSNHTPIGPSISSYLWRNAILPDMTVVDIYHSNDAQEYGVISDDHEEDCEMYRARSGIGAVKVSSIILRLKQWMTSASSPVYSEASRVSWVMLRTRFCSPYAQKTTY